MTPYHKGAYGDDKSRNGYGHLQKKETEKRKCIIKMKK